MWLLYNRFTISRKIDDPSNQDLVDEIGKICYQWATTRDCFSKTPNLSKWKPGMNRTWPSSKSLPRLIVEDRVTDALLDWKDLPDYLCEFRDLRLTLHQRGEIQDLDEMRHHRPTLWTVWGKGKSLIAGNLMQIAAHNTINLIDFGDESSKEVTLTEHLLLPKNIRAVVGISHFVMPNNMYNIKEFQIKQDSSTHVIKSGFYNQKTF